MNFQLDSDGRHVVLSGELTIYTVTEIRDRLLQLLLPPAGEQEIDLSGVAEIDTAGLQLMLLAKKQQQASVRFVNHSKPVQQLIDLANLGRTLGDPVLISAEKPEA